MKKPLSILAAISLVRGQSVAPVQPIPFSHKEHATAARLKCDDCHRPGETGDIQTIPKTKTCMSCHRAEKAASSAIRSLRAYAESNRPVPWVRVYELPGFVNFNHKTHLDSGLSCEICHGQVAERDRLRVETDIGMSGCVTCHESRTASTGCGVCHDLQH